MNKFVEKLNMVKLTVSLLKPCIWHWVIDIVWFEWEFTIFRTIFKIPNRLRSKTTFKMSPATVHWNLNKRQQFPEQILKGNSWILLNLLLLLACETLQPKEKVNLWELAIATHELLHLHQHQSSHEDHLVDGIGGTPWWCDLLSAGLLHSRRPDSWIGPISTYQHWSAQFQCVAFWVWPRLGVEVWSRLLLDDEVIYSRSGLVDFCHSTDHILAIQWAFVSLGIG